MAQKQEQVGPVCGSPPSLEWVPVAQLSVDEAYQRAIDGSKSQRLIFSMVHQWDWALCQPLVVSPRADGALFIIDGQHRHAGAAARGDIAHLPCVILAGRDVEGEAKAFIALNSRRQRLSQADIFNGMLAAGDEQAKSIDAILRQTGWRMRRSSGTNGWHPGDLHCAPMLAVMIKTHGECAVRNALASLREAYPDKVVTNSGTLLRALGTIYRDGLLSGLDPDRFIEALGSIEPTDWTDGIRDRQRANPSLSRQEALVDLILSEATEYARDEAA